MLIEKLFNGVVPKEVIGIDNAVILPADKPAAVNSVALKIYCVFEPP